MSLGRTLAHLQCHQVLHPNSKLSCKVKRKILNRGAGYGLEIPIIYTFSGHEKAIEWIKSKIHEDIKLEQSMNNCCLK